MTRLTDIDLAVRDRLLREGIQLEYLPSPNHNERPPVYATPDTLVVHYTALDMAESVAHLSCPEKQVSTHYVIDRDGTLVQLVPILRRGWHAGVSELYGRKDVNSFSVGLDLVYVPGVDSRFTEPQYRVLAALTRALADHHSLRPENVVGHEHVALPQGRKQDPGPDFHWYRYFEESELGLPPGLVLAVARG